MESKAQHAARIAAQNATRPNQQPATEEASRNVSMISNDGHANPLPQSRVSENNLQGRGRSIPQHPGDRDHPSAGVSYDRILPSDWDASIERGETGSEENVLPEFSDNGSNVDNVGNVNNSVHFSQGTNYGSTMANTHRGSRDEGNDSRSAWFIMGKPWAGDRASSILGDREDMETQDDCLLIAR